ncbi:uncharacterized protein RAG0_09513 [Rhynchosporium agropyri]|uniref:Uncharacterized protein n=1 Tax=Rhynchosporium agropyri TaxID=914238 RepID=A0A1E1KVT6_9HELO|nr:uncharacterized protein RAG0_09513 [Rhynchosporium agropyri]
MTSLISPEQIQVPHPPRPAIRLENLPYDLRLMLWQTTFEDESRVILANSSMKVREAIPPENNHRKEIMALILGTSVEIPELTTAALPEKKFNFDFSPDYQSVVRLAQTFFPREIEQDPSFLKNLFKSRLPQNVMRSSKNIYFIPDLEMFAKVAIEAEDRAARVRSRDASPLVTDRLAPCVFLMPGNQIESIAIEPFSCYPYKTVTDIDEAKKAAECVVAALYDIPMLKTIYVVQSPEDSRAIVLDTPRFKPFPLGQKTTSFHAAGELKRRKLAMDDVVGYESISGTRRLLREKWERHATVQKYSSYMRDFTGPGIGTKRPCPAIRVVSWDI